MKKRLLADLFWTFFQIGLFTFGGGYVMLSSIEDKCVEGKRWITQEEIATVAAIAESTPGPFAINCATYVGYRQAGGAGATLATLGVITPSFLIIYLISLFFRDLLEVPLIANAFRGIRVAVGVLIVRAAFILYKKCPNGTKSAIILALSTVCVLLSNLLSLHISTVYLLLLAGVVNVALYQIGRWRKPESGVER